MVLLIYLVLILITLVLVLGLALGVGWLLTLFLPFRLWEGTVLAMMAGVLLWVVWSAIFRAIGTTTGVAEEDEEDENVLWPSPYPPVRIVPPPFVGRGPEPTWETWFMHSLADRVRERFRESPDRAGGKDDRQLQELALRSAAAAVRILKAKSTQTRHLHVTKGALKREISRGGYPLVEEPVLDLAVTAINEGVDASSSELSRVIRDRAWIEPADLEGKRL
jgi:hypothetical protein